MAACTARRLFARPIAALLALFPFVLAASGAAGSDLSPAQRQSATAYYDAVERGDWIAARAAIDGAPGPLLPKALAWHLYGQKDSGASFTEITTFLQANPQWPGRVLLARRAEEAVALDDPPEALVDWFDRRSPTGFNSWQFYIAAIGRLRGEDAARLAAREAWRDTLFDRERAAEFFARHRGSLTVDDHRARMAMLLRERRSAHARQLLEQADFPAAERRVYALRIRMLGRLDAREAANLEAAVAELPAEVRRAEDMLYDRIRWQRGRGEDRRARELIAYQPAVREHQRRWWIERSIQIRTSLEHGEPRAAFELAAGHKQTGEYEAEQAESLAGWIALRFLEQPETAREHLSRAYSLAPDSFTKARAAYWLGLADLAAGRQSDGMRWLAEAGEHPGTFYGQLAQRRTGMTRLRLPGDIAVSDAARSRFAEQEITRAARLFMALEDAASVRIFLWRRIIDADGAEALAFVAELAREAGAPEFETRAARRAIRDGHGFLRSGFPRLEPEEWPETLANIERELVYAVARQESSFYAEAGSYAGAVGLMQLRPGTARGEARRLRIAYDGTRLISDPDYNLLLGSHYLHRLLARYHGNYPLALAAYNAGPRNVDSWIERLGDPRRSNVDILNWIERIPFGETRDYVRRVLQNLTVYRRLADQDFAGSTLREAWTSAHYARCASIGTC